MTILKTFALAALGIALFGGTGFAETDLSAKGTIVSVDPVTNQVVIRGDSGAESTMQLDANTIARLKPGMTIKASLEDAR